jgi:ACR3 family arsenite transporter
MSSGGRPVAGRLSLTDRYLTLWVLLAMVSGIALGAAVPALDATLSDLQVGTISLPIALGLLLMMYPALAKVRYEELGQLRSQKRLFALALALNWLVAPMVMFALAWLLLPGHADYRTGLIIVGIAPCIAMVLIWNDLAQGDNDAAAVLVALNALIQVALFSVMAYFYLSTLPGWLGLDSQGLHVSVWEIARTVLVFLGLPLAAGYLTRRIALRRRGRAWYEERFLPRLSPVSFFGLLFTVLMLFAIQGDAITSDPASVALIAVPLVLFFAIMFSVGMGTARKVGLPYKGSTTVAFTGASNNFDLAIAVAVGVWGINSGQALASVVGPLIEVPMLVGLVHVSLWLRPLLFPATSELPAPPEIPQQRRT